jgi:hypothetical protein
MATIALREITKQFPGTVAPAVDHVSFELTEGTTCMLVGTSGSGTLDDSDLVLQVACEVLQGPCEAAQLFRIDNRLAHGGPPTQKEATSAVTLANGAAVYNNPDKNAKDDKFVVDVEKPGKTDYEFNLDVAGKDPAQPSPHAIKRLPGI